MLWSASAPACRSANANVEGLTIRAAVDFEAFYARPGQRRRPPGHASGDVLVLSADGKGIVMRADALREATAKAGAARLTEAEGASLARERSANRKRIAEVGAVYDIVPALRTPARCSPRAATKTPPPPKRKGKG